MANKKSIDCNYLKFMEEYPEQFEQDSSLKIITEQEEIGEYSPRVGIKYKSPYNTMIVDLVEDLNGKKYLFERLVPTVKGEAVVVIPKFKDKYVILDQFRHASRKSLFCFPRGYGEKDISSTENAKKELCEELGIKKSDITNVEVIGKTVANSGLCGEEIAVVLAEISTYEFKKSETIEGVFSLTEREVDEFIRNRMFYDGISLSAWAVYKALKE